MLYSLKTSIIYLQFSEKYGIILYILEKRGEIMTQYINSDSLFICILLIILLSFNKRFLKNILTILEVTLIVGGYYYFLSHYKDITILNMIVAYN